jgi:hypothetical protein
VRILSEYKYNIRFIIQNVLFELRSQVLDNRWANVKPDSIRSLQKLIGGSEMIPLGFEFTINTARWAEC